MKENNKTTVYTLYSGVLKSKEVPFSVWLSSGIKKAIVLIAFADLPWLIILSKGNGIDKQLLRCV